jgi:hypothetical protein
MPLSAHRRNCRTATTQPPPRARRGVLVDANRRTWRDLPEEFGDWNSIFGVADATLQMIDATIIRAHHCAAGGRGDRAQRARSRPRRLLHQNKRPQQRRGPAHRRCDTPGQLTTSPRSSAIRNRCSVTGAATARPFATTLRNAVVKPQFSALRTGKYSMSSTRLFILCAIASNVSSIERRTHAPSPPLRQTDGELRRLRAACLHQNLD